MKLYKYLRRCLLAIIGSFIVVALLSTTFISLLSNKALAVQDGSTGKGLTLSPLRSELDITAGTSIGGELVVTNSTDSSMLVNLNAEEFNVIDQQYNYSFSAESDIAKWIKFDPIEAIKLVAGESKKVKFTVNVPLSAEPSGRYISLFASTNIGASDNSASSLQRVASLLYITVLGDVTRSGHLISLTSPWNVDDKSMWSAVLQNTGTTHFHSRYNLQLQNLWGNTVASISGDALILPGTIRAISDAMPLPQLPGLYKIVYTIGLGDTPAVVETRFILYMPSIIPIISISFISMLLIVRLLSKRFSKH